MNYFDSNLQLIKSELYDEIIRIFPYKDIGVLRVDEHRMVIHLIKEYIYYLSGVDELKFSAEISYKSVIIFNITLTMFDVSTANFFNFVDLNHLKKLKERKRKIEDILS